MKLYTLNATPMRRWDQLEAPASDSHLDTRKKDIDSINKMALEEYPRVVARVLAKHGIDGFTIYKVDGYWQGVPEVSFKIEVATDGGVGMIASELRDLYNQDAVMVTHPDNTVEFI